MGKHLKDGDSVQWRYNRKDPWRLGVIDRITQIQGRGMWTTHSFMYWVKTKDNQVIPCEQQNIRRPKADVKSTQQKVQPYPHQASPPAGLGRADVSGPEAVPSGGDSQHDQSPGRNASE